LFTELTKWPIGHTRHRGDKQVVGERKGTDLHEGAVARDSGKG